MLHKWEIFGIKNLQLSNTLDFYYYKNNNTIIIMSTFHIHDLQ